MVEFRKNASRDTLYDLAVKNGVAVAADADRDAIIKALTAHNTQEAANAAAGGATEAAGSGPELEETKDTTQEENAAERPAEGEQEGGETPSQGDAKGEDTNGAEYSTTGGENSVKSTTEYDTFAYAGPSIPRGRLKENAVFRGTLEDVLEYLADVIEDYPQIPRLIVPTSKLAVFAVKVKTPGNIAHKYYTDIASAVRSRKGKGGVNGG